MKKLISLALIAVCASAFAEEKKLDFNWLVETKGWTTQLVVMYQIGQLQELFNLKNFNLNIVSLAGYDLNAEQPNLGGGFVYPLQIAKNGYLNLGGRIAFQEYKKPEFGFIVGISFQF